MENYEQSFSSKSLNITHSLLEFDPVITNMVVPLRGDLPLERGAASKVNVQNVWTKNVKDFHIPNVAKLTHKKFDSASSLEVPTASMRENVRQKRD